jgi:hypothetical protein
MTAPVPPSPSGEPPTVNDTRILCAVCGIWQCLARHGGGFCHAVNGPSDTSCGACYANRPTIQRDLTVASEEPPGCRQRAASLHPRLGLSYADEAVGPGNTMTYFPPVPAPVPEKCPGCGAWYIRPSGVHVGCCVAHSPGTCCHFGETKVEAPLEVVRNELVKDIECAFDESEAERSRLAGENAELRKDAEHWRSHCIIINQDPPKPSEDF